MNKNYYNFGSRRISCTSILFLVCFFPAVLFAQVPQGVQSINADVRLASILVETAVTVASLGQEEARIEARSVQHDSVADRASRHQGVRGSDDAVIAQDGDVPQGLISIAFTPADMGFGQGSRSNNSAQKVVSGPAGDLMNVSEHSESRQIPYSLVLALIALIGLVPVSRRNR